MIARQHATTLFSNGLVAAFQSNDGPSFDKLSCWIGVKFRGKPFGLTLAKTLCLASLRCYRLPILLAILSPVCHYGKEAFLSF